MKLRFTALVFLTIAMVCSSCSTSKPTGETVTFKNDVKCNKPADYETTHNPSLDVKFKDIVELTVSDDSKVKKLRDLSQSAQDIDSQAFRLCESYGNGMIDKETYKEYYKYILMWKNDSQKKTL